MSSELDHDERATASTTPPDRIEGPFLEYDRYDERTGAEFYRYVCGREALRRVDLRCEDCDRRRP